MPFNLNQPASTKAGAIHSYGQPEKMAKSEMSLTPLVKSEITQVTIAEQFPYDIRDYN